MLDAALAAIDPDALARDLATLVQVPSLTGDEREVMERFAELAAAQGLESEVVEHDLQALRAHPDHPGEEAPRTSLFGALATLRGPEGAPRIALNGHLDVVGPGEQPWQRDPFSGAIADGFVHGRGSADMKGGLVAALHAAGAVARAARATGTALPLEVVVQAVPSEEDGGLGTFAALEADARFDAALIPEPTAFGLAAAQAGALTFNGTIPGVPAHAAVRLEGVSAIDRYVLVHQALQEHERTVNGRPSHPLLDALELPYPLLVGKVQGGAWSSQVPDLLTFEGRVGVRVDETVEEARAALERVVHEACPEATIAWTGGQYAPGATAPDHPFLARVADATEAERGVRSPAIGVPYGSDMRFFTARGIPAVMLGPSGIELAHAVDERVPVDDLVQIARIYVRALLGEAAQSR
ncbi:MAG TPA: M20/M25/M40 family metallo-hydrolase [Solirubrobacteraceae bacterium]|nr:M20/M25/M40 family metallo-hydrolase [Solirubrobacteraceae bacterium]